MTLYLTKQSSALTYTSRLYSDALAIQQAALYIPYGTSSHEQNGNIITFAQFEEGGVLENNRNAEENKSISAPIDESSTDNEYNGGSISTSTIEDIQNGNKIHPELNARDARLKISECIKQMQNEWKVAQLSAKSMGNFLHKVFNAVVNELNNSLPNLLESGSEVSHFIPEPRNFSEVTGLSADIKKAWLKVTMKDIKSLINNQTFIMDEPEKGYPVTPCMGVYKAKIKYDGSLSKLKLIIVVIEYLQNKEMIGYTWYPTASMRNLKYFLSDTDKHKERVQ